MLSEVGRRPTLGANEGSFGDDFEKEIGLLLREQRRQEADDRERELNLYRSGSAPPTVEGSLNAVGGLFGQGDSGAFPELPVCENGNMSGLTPDEAYRSDPAYVSFYFSKSHLNPRLPPPLLSREDWRFAQRLKGGNSVIGGIGDRRKVSRPENGGGRARASMPPGFDLRKDSNAHSEKGAADWDKNGLIGLSGLGLGSKQKSLAEIFQNDLGRSSPVSGHPSRPASRNATDENAESICLAEEGLSHLRHELTSTEALRSHSDVQGTSAIGPNISQSASYSYAAVLGTSLSRSTTPDPQLVARAPSPCLTPIGGGRSITSEKRGVNSPNTFNGVSSVARESADLAAALSGMNISANGSIQENNLPSQIEEDTHQNYLFNFQEAQNHTNNHSSLKTSGNIPSFPTKVSYSDLGMGKGNGSDLSNSFVKRSSIPMINNGVSIHPQYPQVDNTNLSFQNYALAGYNVNPALASMVSNHIGTGNLPPLYENLAAASALGSPGMDSRILGGMGSGSNFGHDGENLNRMGNQLGGSALQAPFLDPMYLQSMRTAEFAAAQGSAFHDPSVGNSFIDVLGLQRAYLGSLLSPSKSHYGGSVGGKSTGSNHHGFYGSSPYGVGMSYPGSPLATPVLPNSLVGPGSPIRHNEFNMRLPSKMRNLAGGVMGPWHLDGSSVDDGFASSLLEEFKSNKTKCFELSEITGHVVEFSADQYGSRFIQQKLETATMEEKKMVYEEIMPQALSLMTDVFGNYVVQKFFEHGATSQRRELANKLNGHVLTLSLQMYGCRVIQKAIEVVDVDQKISMVGELDGHVMRCVRDQNGNHVIQKCIECVPEEAIQFIVTTFFDQVVTLSTHPYGCRVIQRILEHCEDAKTQDKVMDEILGSVSMLAQDQYGNYVVQHVLEHGKSHERSTIIEELAGKIVQMSQQKFASNVVEKCLTFGGPSEREILVNEMLGTTDENEPLQAMMKDQFANYVVQKVLETCDDQQRELILTRIKVHLNALKKYTYGKHIVARVEKLVAAGERRIAIQSAHPA